MSKIKVPAETCSELAKSESVAEICDESGVTLGYFIPQHCQIGKLPIGLEIPYSNEEIQALRKCRSGRTLEEILAGLGLERAIMFFGFQRPTNSFKT